MAVNPALFDMIVLQLMARGQSRQAATESLGGSSGGSVGAFGSVAAQAAGGDAGAQLMMATKEMQEMNQSFNLQYLQLQQKMQSDNRQFTLMSNIMKTKHDTAKNAINNVR